MSPPTLEALNKVNQEISSVQSRREEAAFNISRNEKDKSKSSSAENVTKNLSLELGSGSSWNKASNYVGYYKGFIPRVSAGYKFRLGRHTVVPRIFFENQSLDSNNSPSINTFGIEGEYNINPTKKFSIGSYVNLGFGVAKSSGQSVILADLPGGRIPDLVDINNASGLYYGAGLSIKALDGSIGLRVGWHRFNAKADKMEIVVDGEVRPLKVNVEGPSIMLTTDVFGLVNSIL